MGILSKLKKRKKEAEVDEKKQLVIDDANRVLGIIRSSMNFSAVEVKEIIYKFGMTEGMPYDAMSGRFRGNAEERVMDALTLLKEKKVLGWGGKFGDVVCFNKRQLPGVIG